MFHHQTLTLSFCRRPREHRHVHRQDLPPWKHGQHHQSASWDDRRIRRRNGGLHRSERNPDIWTGRKGERGASRIELKSKGPRRRKSPTAKDEWLPFLDWCTNRGRQPVGAGRGVLPEAHSHSWQGQRGGAAGEDFHHGDHHTQRRWYDLQWKDQCLLARQCWSFIGFLLFCNSFVLFDKQKFSCLYFCF